jgi:hypothetical protein
MARFIKA